MNQITILSIPYKIEWHSNLSCFGEVNHKSQTIRIDSLIPPHQQLSTLLHESIHAMDWRLKTNLSEEQVYALEAGLFDMLVRNPKLIQMFGEINESQSNKR